jgi:hypothetical protein
MPVPEQEQCQSLRAFDQIPYQLFNGKSRSFSVASVQNSLLRSAGALYLNAPVQGIQWLDPLTEEYCHFQCSICR